MNVKTIDLATNKKRNENVQKRTLQRQNETPKHFTFPKPKTLLLSDTSEFPSLSESFERASKSLPLSGEPLRYSDKLKSPSSNRNHASISGNMQFKSNTSITDASPCSNKFTRSKFHSSDNKHELDDNSKQNVPKEISDCSLNKPVSLSKEKCYLEKKELMKQKPISKSKLSVQNIKSTTFSSDNTNISATPSNQGNRSVIVESDELKGGDITTQDSSKAKKKKKRKSKVKRQVALQSGKITFLTPEVHSKILNQASTSLAQISMKSSAIGNFNDEEEYPELGKPTNLKENFLKRNISSECQVDIADKSADPSVEKNVISENIVLDSPVIAAPEKAVVEKNYKVQYHNPITVSFYEMLLEKNVKKKEIKEFKDKTENINVIELPKFKIKKNEKHPHNLLDASSPAVKRGKEREKPKPKKPSQLKKIILLDRKARREHLLQMKNIYEKENVTNENELMFKLPEDENNETGTGKENQHEDNFDYDLSLLWKENEENVETILQLIQNTDICVQDELISEMMHLNASEENNDYNIMNDLSSDFIEVVEKEVFGENSSSVSSLNNEFKIKTDMNVDKQISSQTKNPPVVDTEIHLNVQRSPDSLLNCLTGNVKTGISDKERAVKILLHTRNFREYCNHLISKDIDDATFALLDDLARFQDRLHQKDPVKARMKKRMIYGVKEVKKHIKLRKLKCIIIAVDIENVETHGGLNDVLNEIKTSAVDHHIPYIFALSRKVLGKVCHKPVPVSCVGIFNYEGSEANFKKMVELQSQSKIDYIEIFDKLLMKITDEEVSTLIKAKKEAPETLRDVRANILSKFFLPLDSAKNEEENGGIKSNEDLLNFIDTPT